MRLFLIILFFPLYCNSQSLIYELAIVWQKNKDSLVFKNEFLSPHLKITIKNLGMDSIYFENHFYNEDDLPTVSYFSLPFPETRTKKKLLRLHNTYESNTQNYFVTLKKNSFNKIPTFSLFDNSDYKKHLNDNEIIGFPYRAAELKNLYSLFDLQRFYEKNKLKKQSQLFSYNNKKTMNQRTVRSDIIEMQAQRIYNIRVERKNINLKDYYQSDKFIFLIPGETKIVSYNLMPFKIIGGKYTFLLDFFEPKQFIIAKIKEGNEPEKIKLPKYVNGYKLYLNDIISNEIIIKF
jgi:hypothetical protein